MSAGETSRPAISGKARASFALAVLSLGLGAVASVLVLPLGIVCLALAVLALRDISRSQRRLKGRLVAIVSIALEVTGMVVFLFLVPAAREVVHRTNSI